MKEKTVAPEKLQKLQLKREKEIKKWEKEKNRPKRNTYFLYLVFIITLIYAVDEIASQIGTLMKTEIANDLFASFGQSSVGVLDMLSVLVVPFQAIGLLYRPLADRFGRKVFLIINTFGMSLAMLVIFMSNNIVLYFIGACMVQFFIPHDMHVVYIMESAPSEKRAVFYSVVKFVANMGVMLIPLLRRMLMQEASQWRRIYLIPAIVGLVTSFIALLSARETDAFIESRLKYLRMSEEERAELKRQKDADNAQGGLFPALKFAFKHKQLRWLYISATIANIGFIATVNYQVIMSYGFAENFINKGLFSGFGEEVMNAVSVGPITAALFAFPLGSAIAQVIMGFISDGKGRKTAAITTAVNCIISFIVFFFGAKFGWNPYLVGFFCGAHIGSYYSTNDVLIMMIGESSPTNLRSSTISAQYIVVAIGFAISNLVALPIMTALGNQYTGVVAFCLLVPGFLGALVAMSVKTRDTKGIDMDTVTGCEWD